MNDTGKISEGIELIEKCMEKLYDGEKLISLCGLNCKYIGDLKRMIESYCSERQKVCRIQFAQEWIADYLEEMQKLSKAELKSYVVEPDVFVLDHIESFVGKPAVQEEVRGVLTLRYEAGKQTVVIYNERIDELHFEEDLLALIKSVA